MELKASVESSPLGELLIVKQIGGFTAENRVVLRSIGKGRYWNGKSFRTWDGEKWVFGYSQGSLSSLQQAAYFIEAKLTLSEELDQRLEDLQNSIKMEEKTRQLIQRYMDNTDLKLGSYITQVEPPPWRHQQLAYHWAMRMDAIYIQHKPGLGKTRSGADIARGRFNRGDIRQPESIWLPDRWSRAKPEQALEARWGVKGGFLIVCPNVMLGTWQEQLMAWQNIYGQIISGHSRKKKLEQAGVPALAHICTYDSLDIVEDNQYDMIIGDELHSIASHESIRWCRMCRLRESAKFVVGLSGTPISNMLPSLWSQYFWLDNGRSLGSTYEEYKRRYFKGGRKLEPKEGSQDAIAARISRISYPLTMQEAFPDKAKKIQQVERIPMTNEQIRYYHRVRDNLVADIMTGTVTTDAITTQLTKLQQICQGWVKDDTGNIQEFTSAKMDALMEMLTGQGDLASERVIIWCRFRRDLHKIIHALEQAGKPTLMLKGGMGRKLEEWTKDSWNNDYRYRCMVGMIQKGIGINLHAPNCVDSNGNPDRAHTTIFYGLDWKVTSLEQAMDRVYRGDQVETCLYRYLLSEELSGSFDDNGNPLQPLDVRIYDLLQRKLILATEVSEDSIDYVRSLLGA